MNNDSKCALNANINKATVKRSPDSEVTFAQAENGKKLFFSLFLTTEQDKSSADFPHEDYIDSNFHGLAA